MNSTNLILGLLFGSLGLGYFQYGRKQHKPLTLACGLTLIVFPYFVTQIALLIIIGVALSLLPIVSRK